MKKSLIVLICWHCLWVGVALGRVFVDGQQARKIQYAAASPAGPYYDTNCVIALDWNNQTDSEAGTYTNCPPSGWNFPASQPTSEWRAAWSSSGLIFDGTNDFCGRWPSNSIINLEGVPWYISVWVKPNLAGGDYRTIASHGFNMHQIWELMFIPDGRLAFLTLKDGEWTWCYSDATAFTNGAWYHIVAGWDKTNSLMWINSVAQTPQANGDGVQNYDAGNGHSYNFTVGAYGDAVSDVEAPIQNFGGTVAKLRLYRNRAVVQVDVDALWTNTP